MRGLDIAGAVNPPLGDALALAVMQAKGFSRDEFARSHPGGALGRRLLTHVRDVMRSGEDAPRVAETATLSDAILEMTRSRMGITAVLDANNRVTGIFTDGEITRVAQFTTLCGHSRALAHP